MSIHSPEHMFENEPPPSQDDLRSIQRTLWDVVPDEVAELTAAGRGAASAQPSDALLKVYLRMRPLTAAEEQSQIDTLPFLQVESDADVLTHPPENSAAYKNTSRGGEVATRYTFSKIFAPEAGQQSFFADTTVPLIQNVLLGQSALLFTYGVTNAGKTYTVQGTPEEPGLLPRTLDAIFNSIADQTVGGPAKHLPACFSDVKSMSLSDYEKHVKLKESILDSCEATSATSQDEASETSSAMATEEGGSSVFDDGLSAVDAELRPLIDGDRQIDGTTLTVDTESEYSVFVSYAEIYNEQVYDLLLPMSGNRRDASRLGEKDGEVYIRNLREIHVTSTCEALRLVHAGQRNRQVAATKSNHESSRSHGVFTVKLIRKETTAPYTAALSQFTIVDLAGSERYKKTDATGMRIKEAGTINTSLMTLGKCLESIRNKQARKSNTKIVPYRDSKLTRMFKFYLEGKGSTSMVVNVANLNSTFDETAHALKFSAMARQVTAGPIISKIDTGINRLQREIESAYQDDIEDLDAYNTTLLDMLQEVKQQLFEAQCQASETEERVRAEVAEEMASQMAELEERYENALAQQAEVTEAKYNKKWQAYSRSVARMPAVSRTLVAPKEDADSRAANLELELQSQRAVVAALHSEMDTAQEEANFKIASLEAEKNELERSAIEKLKAQEDIVHAQIATATEDVLHTAEERRLAFIGEIEDLKEQLGDSRQQIAELTSKNAELAEENVKLTTTLNSTVSKVDFDELRKEHTALKKNSTASMQKSKLVIASLKRKVEEQQDSIEALSKDIGSEETKYDHLRGQLAHALENRIECDSKKGEEPRVPKDTRRRSTRRSSAGIHEIPVALAAATPLKDLPEEAASAISAAAVEDSEPQPATPPRPAKGRRRKRKGTPAPDKENPTPVAPGGRTPKKLRVAGSSALSEKGKISSMMSPLTRRLRPRRRQVDE